MYSIADASSLTNGSVENLALQQANRLGQPISPTPAAGVPAMFTINQLKRKFDSVDNIMDRIDEGISTLKKIEVTAPYMDALESEGVCALSAHSRIHSWLFLDITFCKFMYLGRNNSHIICCKNAMQLVLVTTQTVRRGWSHGFSLSLLRCMAPQHPLCL